MPLSAFPEELLERILSLSVVAPLTPTARPQWHQRSNSDAVKGRLAPLLVCRKFFRICTPLFYHTIHITSPAQLHKLLSVALRPNHYLATHVRRLLFAGIWAQGGELLYMCSNNIKMLDITLDVTQLAPGVHANRGQRDLDAEDFCEGLQHITNSLTHLVLRKSSNVYLTQPKPKYVLGGIAKAMRQWDNLELTDIAFRLSDDSGIGSLSLNQHLPHPNSSELQGPITLLTHALITRPKLRTFCTLLPSLWNETILRISSNPNLECIVLGDGTYRHARSTSLGKNSDTFAFDAGSAGIVGTGLFLTQAKKHTRLSDLIRAGTSIMRTRAQTLGTVSSHQPPSPSYSSPRSPTSPHFNYTRSQSMIPTSSSSGPSTVSSTSSSSSSQKYQHQRQADDQSQNKMWNQHHHTTKCDLSRATTASASKPLSRSIMPGAF